jgi:hypothetical protein
LSTSVLGVTTAILAVRQQHHGLVCGDDDAGHHGHGAVVTVQTPSPPIVTLSPNPSPLPRTSPLCLRTTFAYGDLVMTHEGRCRLQPQLARAVVAACRLDQERVSAGAQQLREMLVEGIVSTRPSL